MLVFSTVLCGSETWTTYRRHIRALQTQTLSNTCVLATQEDYKTHVYLNRPSTEWPHYRPRGHKETQNYHKETQNHHR